MLQISIPIYSLTGIDGCKQYLAASDAKKKFKICDFIFPTIYKNCLICHCAGCAIWKGYYSRQFFCPKLEFNGRIWLRKGFCKTTKTHFSMLPDFCVPDIRWSKFTFTELFNLKDLSFFHTFDLDIAFSSLYWIGALLVKLLRINSHLFLQPPPESNSVCELKNFSFELMSNLPLRPEFDWNKVIIPSSNSPPF
jgi:hypothetical protein